METTGSILRRLMQEREMTLGKLSEKSNVSVSAIKSILSGKTKKPRYKTIKKLASALEVHEDKIIPLHKKEEETTGDIIRRLIEERMMTQEEFSEKIGMEKRVLNTVINNKCEPRIPMLRNIARGLGVKVTDLNPRALKKVNDAKDYTLGSTLLRICYEKEISPLELAKASHLTKQAIYNVISNKHFPRKETLYKIANALQIPIGTFSRFL